jgi:hypothetical protein
MRESDLALRSVQDELKLLSAIGLVRSHVAGPSFAGEKQSEDLGSSLREQNLQNGLPCAHFLPYQNLNAFCIQV